MQPPHGRMLHLQSLIRRFAEKGIDAKQCSQQPSKNRRKMIQTVFLNQLSKCRPGCTNYSGAWTLPSKDLNP